MRQIPNLQSIKTNLEVTYSLLYICSGQKNNRRERLPFPSLFTMTSETVLQQIENMVIGLLAAEPSHFLVGIKIKPTNNIKVFIDGDNGLPIEKCVRYNRSLYKLIEEAGFYPEGDFSLEVSSPGIGEPLKMLRQYTKNKGRFVEVVFLDDTKKEGQLIEVTENDILIEQTTGKGKKLETAQFLIPFDNIKSTTVQIKF